MTRIPLQTKYTPQTMNDIVFSNPEAELFVPLIGKNIHPCTHLMLYGTSGNGKTSAAKIVAHELTKGGLTYLKHDLTNFLAIQDMGNFLSNTILVGSTNFDRCVIVFNELDEHKGSLVKLWNIMDEFEKQLMVIFTTNNPTKFQNPVLSRCDKYEFTKVTAQQFSTRAAQILQAEGVKLSVQDITHYLTIHTGAMADVRDYMRVMEKILTLALTNQLPPLPKQAVNVAQQSLPKPRLKIKK